MNSVAQMSPGIVYTVAHLPVVQQVGLATFPRWGRGSHGHHAAHDVDQRGVAGDHRGYRNGFPVDQQPRLML